MTWSRQQRHKARAAKVERDASGSAPAWEEQVATSVERVDDEFHERGVRERHEELRKRFRAPGPIGDPQDMER